MSYKVRTTWIYYLGRFFYRIFFLIFAKAKINGKENIPKSGGVIIASNHRSLFDPPFVGSSMKRPLFFMAKKELFGVPVLGYLIQRTNAFPVKRGERDVGAFRTAQKLLEQGKAVLVFPEGTRSKDEGFRENISPGVGMLACLVQVPVVPARVINTDKIFKRKRIEITFGKPIYPPEKFTKETYQKLSEKVMERIKTL